MFSESLPDQKDTGFLGVFYRPDAGKEYQICIYLPELHSTRRLMQSQPANGHGHDMTSHMHHGENTDEFSVSDLDHEELMPRWPGLDNHRMLGIEDYEGMPVYRIESISRDPATLVYGKRVPWVEQEHALLVGIEYYEPDGRHVKTQTQPGGPGAQAQDELHAFPRGVRPEQPASRFDHPGQVGRGQQRQGIR